MKLATKDEIREIDRRCVSEYGIPSIDLMENAAEAVVRYIGWSVTDYRNAKFAVICGSGNNGGDGAAIARMLHLEGIDVTLVCSEDIDLSKGDAAINFQKAREAGTPIENVRTIGEWDSARQMISGCDVFIDAIFGTGFRDEACEPVVSIIRFLNAQKKVISVDIPSGVYANGGAAQDAVKASATVTFGLPKLSMADFPARLLCGEIFADSIGIPPSLLENVDLKHNLLTKKDVQKLYHPRATDLHKGSFGHCLIIGNIFKDSGATVASMAGAARIATAAALRSGCGLTTAVVPEVQVQAYLDSLPEAMVLAVRDADEDAVWESIRDYIRKRKVNSVLIGNGWGRGSDRQRLLKRILKDDSGVCLTIDADGLNNLSEMPEWAEALRSRQGKALLTPHIGEAVRLTGKTSQVVKASKTEIARDTAEMTQTVVALKDAVSVAGLPDGQVWLSGFGSVCLAKGGSGDALAGTIAGLCAAGYDAADAVLLGMYVLGRAGEIYESTRGVETALASDIIGLYPNVFFELNGAGKKNPV